MRETERWDGTVEVHVVVRIKAEPDPERFEGWQGRTPEMLAEQVASNGDLHDLTLADGWADLRGRATVESVTWTAPYREEARP